MDYDTLYGLSDCELRHRIRHFPQQPQRFGDVELYRDEQRRRQQDRQTWAMIALTIVATIATMASVFIAIFK